MPINVLSILYLASEAPTTGTPSVKARHVAMVHESQAFGVGGASEEPERHLDSEDLSTKWAISIHFTSFSMHFTSSQAVALHFSGSRASVT